MQLYKNLSEKEWSKRYQKGEHWEGKREHSRHLDNFISLLNKKDKILDLGCGSGRDSIYLAKLGFFVSGIDISKEAIEKAKSKYSSSNLMFSVGDVAHLNFSDNSFDKIYSNWVLNVVSDLKSAANEMYRILRKKGIAYLTFLLQKVSLQGVEIENFYSETEILKNFSNFHILEKKTGTSEDLDAEEPHIHKTLILVLEKV